MCPQNAALPVRQGSARYGSEALAFPLSSGMVRLLSPPCPPASPRGPTAAMAEPFSPLPEKCEMLGSVVPRCHA